MKHECGHESSSVCGRCYTDLAVRLDKAEAEASRLRPAMSREWHRAERAEAELADAEERHKKSDWCREQAERELRTLKSWVEARKMGEPEKTDPDSELCARIGDSCLSKKLVIKLKEQVKYLDEERIRHYKDFIKAYTKTLDLTDSLKSAMTNINFWRDDAKRLASEVRLLEGALSHIKRGADNQGAHTGMSWVEVGRIAEGALRDK